MGNKPKITKNNFTFYLGIASPLLCVTSNWFATIKGKGKGKGKGKRN